MENLIEVSHITKDYGDNKGIFDVSFELRKGEILGFVGANGAGKTTTIRNIMGFLKPDSGNIKIKNLDSWQEAEKTKKYIGYVPGEIAFPDLKTGTEFLKSQAEFCGITDLSYANEITKRLQLDTSANLKRMSKGMKQKTALVSALLPNPEILILDEPTTGLDPLMRVSFLKILSEEKKKGKTILISSHLYEELEKIADRVMLIDKGKIINITDMNEIRNRPVADFKIEFNSKEDYEKFLLLDYKITRKQSQYNQVTINIDKKDIQKLFKDLKNFDVKFISEVKYTLEKHFIKIIENQKENKND
jgi:ABC-2 type transport system ATP-binding protein